MAVTETKNAPLVVVPEKKPVANEKEKGTDPSKDIVIGIGKPAVLENTLFEKKPTTDSEKKPTVVNEKKEEGGFWSKCWGGVKKVCSSVSNALNPDTGCTDGKDDGHISFKEGAKAFGKGLLGIVKAAIDHPLITAGVIAGGIALTVATGGAALPWLVAAGAVIGAGQVGYGTYKVATAKNDSEAKQGYGLMGNGVTSLALSGLAAKPALNAAANGGVASAEGASELNTVQALGKCFSPQVLGESALQSGKNIGGNAMTWASGVKDVHLEGWRPKVEFNTNYANSNALRAGQVAYVSKPNEVKAYRFNPNGSEAEVLKNNPGVIVKDGQYCIPNKWNPESPHLINTAKGDPMIMMYGSDDMAVCDAGVFKGSYVDTPAFKADGALNYQDPAKLPYGQVVDVTKQAPGAFKFAPVGTKVQTLEGPQTVGEGQVVAFDHAGNPYVTTMSNILKRNMPIEGDAVSQRVFNVLKIKDEHGFWINPAKVKAFADYKNTLLRPWSGGEPRKMDAGIFKIMTKFLAELDGKPVTQETVEAALHVARTQAEELTNAIGSPPCQVNNILRSALIESTPSNLPSSNLSTPEILDDLLGSMPVKFSPQGEALSEFLTSEAIYKGK